MGKLGLNSGYIGSDQRTTTNGVVGYDKFYLERRAGRFNPVLELTGLLDFYPGATVAYSLRRLSGVYQGSAIRVRRSSDNTEADIGFSSIDLNTSALLAFCGAGNGFVTTWYDQSGNANNATQTTAANQPQIVSSGIVILENGKPAINWNGSNYWLKTATISPTIAQPVSYFITAQIDAITNNALIDGVTNAGGLFYRSTANNIEYSFGTSLTDASVPSTQLLFTVLANGASSSVYNNAILQVSGNVGTQGVNGFVIGNLGSAFQNVGYQLKGSLQEIVFYPSNKSSDRIGIETNINSFYSIY
jgi:hypothetical protein